MEGTDAQPPSAALSVEALHVGTFRIRYRLFRRRRDKKGVTEMSNQNTGTGKAEEDVTAHSDPGTPITVGGDGGSATGTPITVGGDGGQ